MSATNSNTPPGPALTMQGLLESMRAIKAALNENPEPIGEWVRRQGFPPETCSLLLPEHKRDELGPFWPPYVLFSPYVHAPTLVRFTPQQGLRVDPPTP